MDELTEREVHELVLDVIVQGRLLAEEWPDAGVVPRGCSKNLILETLKKLRQRQGYETLDEDLLDLLGDTIRRSANEHREDLGDRSLKFDIETENIFDSRTIELINLMHRWKLLRRSKRALDDKMEALKFGEKALSKIH